MSELRERRAEALYSRRELLKRGGLLGAAALAGSSMLSARAYAASASTPTIAIVGGVIAGLNAALTLEDKGLRSTVYEVAGRWAARMHSDRTGYWANGQISEFCGELIDTNHTTIQALATSTSRSPICSRRSRPGRGRPTGCWAAATHKARRTPTSSRCGTRRRTTSRPRGIRRSTTTSSRPAGRST